VLQPGGMPSDAKPPPDLNKAYDPREVEERWYEFWEANGVFDATDDAKDARPPYVIPMPPPNVTGSLHMGHAQRCTLEDGLIRYHRMRGYNALWQPGIDHAGIATQVVVERQLARENKTRHDLGRDKFVERVWQWKAESGGRIQVQQRVLGASPDWRRSKFTMDPAMNRAVVEAFVRLYEAGLMYRATRLINWCPECRTGLSDLEVENEETNGELFQFAYPIVGGGGDPAALPEIVVATTRPETMLGDTAVAVHPDDERYKALHGKRLQHPFLDRTIPLITDAILVDPKFGTGAVKVTPAHDFNDFATGKRHKLEEISIFELDGTTNANAGPFAGLDRKRARTAVKKALEEKGLARGTKPHKLTLPKCQRSGGVVEPMISTQWWLDMKGMAREALEAVHSGRTKVIPEEWVKTYDHFLENIQDWNVSRQLWWGHQIPAWHGPKGEIKVARECPRECTPEAGWTQDPDVLDTWFSAALWPFSTLGWPDETPALRKFYPASDMETGYDILFFWVARMMMFGLYFMKEVPFRRVLLSGLIVDETGEKMSKVKGNVIDPLDLIYGTTFTEMVKKTLPGAPEGEALAKFKKAYPSAAQMGAGFPAFGADAVRFTLATYPPSNKRIALAPKRIEGNRHFLNKIWNATRLVLDLVGGDARGGDPPRPAHLYERWILSRLHRTIGIVHEGMGAFRIDEAANELYRFFWYDYCDWYLELAKTRLREGVEEKEPIRATLLHVLDASLRLLHPFVPFVTEELWQRLPIRRSKKSIALARYPEPGDVVGDEGAEKEMSLLQAVIGAARTVRSEHEVHPGAEVALDIHTDNRAALAVLEKRVDVIKFLAKTRDLGKLGRPREPGMVASVVPADGGPVEVLVGLKGLITKDEELARIDRERKRIEKDVAAVEKKLASPGFVDRAPPEVVEEARKQRATLVDALARLDNAKKLAEEL
jgi:valyl-tRNA synthetase